jgi:hypothetical protein
MQLLMVCRGNAERAVNSGRNSSGENSWQDLLPDGFAPQHPATDAELDW